MKKFERHPLSKVFPDMDEQAYKALCKDIEVNGVFDPIVVHEGMILDGWHRYLACQELRILKPPVEQYEGDDPIAFVLSKNWHRRHLVTASARALIIADITKWNEKVGRPSKSLDMLKDENIYTLSGAASLAQVSVPTMQNARKATKAIEEVKQEVIKGNLTVFDAAKLADKSPEEQKKAISEPREKTTAKKTVPLDQYEALQRVFDEMESQYDAMSKELQSVEAVRNNEQVKEMMALHQKIDMLTKSRDDLMNKNAELTKQLNWAQAQLKKLAK